MRVSPFLPMIFAQSACATKIREGASPSSKRPRLQLREGDFARCRLRLGDLLHRFAPLRDERRGDLDGDDRARWRRRRRRCTGGELRLLDRERAIDQHGGDLRLNAS